MHFFPEKPVGLIYNSTEQFNPLIQHLQKEGLAFDVIRPSSLHWNYNQTEFPYSLIINDMSTTPYVKYDAMQNKNTIAYLRHLEQAARGSTIINGSSITETFAQRIRQLNIFRSLGVSFPKTAVVGCLDQFLKISAHLKFPMLLGTNETADDPILFESEEHLIATLIQEDLQFESRPLIVQEYRPAKGNHTVRAELINGRFQYAVKVFHPGELHAGSLETRLAHFDAPFSLIATFEKIARAAQMDIGSIECFTDRQSNTLLFHRIQPHTSAYTLPVEGLPFSMSEKIIGYVFHRLRKLREIELTI